MSFLKNPNTYKRLYLQLLGFQSNTYFDRASDFVQKSPFILPSIHILQEEMIRLEMPEHIRLGHRLERFFSFIIQQSKDYDIVLENLQIFQEKITLGELDFILKKRSTQELIHVELGGKLYLYDPELATKALSGWIGPNRKDSLLRKLDTLKSKQFPLLYRNETKEALASKEIPVDSIIQQICFKARLFVPYKNNEQWQRHDFSKNIMGYYLNLEEFRVLNKTSFAYFLPEKQDWIVAPEFGEIWCSFEQILPKIEQLLEQKQSPLLWINRGNQKYETIFVVWW